MSDVNVRSDSVDVEQIMRQIRTRIREKRGTDYTEAELQRLASAKFDKFADPSGLRSDLLEQFRKRGDEPSTYHRHRGVRRLLLMIAHPLLKRVQKQLMSDLNLYFEIIHNLVIEVTRLGVEVHTLKMKVESMSSRLDFDERRGRALEGVVQYRQRPGSSGSQGSSGSSGSGSQGSAGSSGSQIASSSQSSPAASAPQISGSPAPAAGQSPPAQGAASQDGDVRRRRRRRRRRRPGHSLAESPNAQGGGPNTAGGSPQSGSPTLPDADDGGGDDGADDQ